MALTEDEVQIAVNKLNHRSSKSLGCKTSNELFTAQSKREFVKAKIKNLVKSTIRFVTHSKSIKCISSPIYAEKYGAKWHKVYEKKANTIGLPIFLGKKTVDLSSRLDKVFPEMGVLEVKNALIYGKDGLIITREGFFLSDHSWFGKNTKEMKRLPRVMSKGTMIYGKVLSLASDFAVNSYGHFVIDSLARLKLFYDAGYNFDHVDYIFCPKPTPGNAEILFNKLGIPVDKCIWADDNRVLRVETLIAITFPGTRRNYPSWVTEFLQSRILPTMSKPRRRLYISRTGYSRNIENEHEIFNILKRYDFEIYNPTDNENSHLDFAEAAVVIGISGSALTGLAFCQAGTKVLELMGTDHVYPYYYTLSDAANLQYNVLVCQSSHERRTDAWGPSPANIYVDEKEFEAALREFEQTN